MAPGHKIKESEGTGQFLCNKNGTKEELNGKLIIVCFWDMLQRPSRNCLWQLSKRAPKLKAKDVVVVAVQASKVNEETLNEWMKKNNIQKK